MTTEIAAQNGNGASRPGQAPGAPWEVEAVEPAGPAPDVERWRGARRRVVEIAKARGLTKTEVSKAAGIPQGTFWQWFDGTYRGVIGNVTAKVEQWLQSLAEQEAAALTVPAAPGYVETPTATLLTDSLLYAQVMPEIIIGVLGAGMGKTITARRFVETRPHAYMVTMRPTTASVNAMLAELAIAVDIETGARVRPGLDRKIGRKLMRNGRSTLLIVDEAQSLSDQAVNQLRYLHDDYGVGIALLGNEELYGRFGGSTPTPAYAQLHRRFGRRVKRMQPVPGDIDALVDAWGISDPEIRRLCHAIGRKPGALGQISKTLQLAGMYAAGDGGRAINVGDIRAALQNRGLEEH